MNRLSREPCYRSASKLEESLLSDIRMLSLSWTSVVHHECSVVAYPLSSSSSITLLLLSSCLSPCTAFISKTSKIPSTVWNELLLILFFFSSSYSENSQEVGTVTERANCFSLLCTLCFCTCTFISCSISNK